VKEQDGVSDILLQVKMARWSEKSLLIRKMAPIATLYRTT